MKIYDQPPVTTNRFERPADDLDNLLHEFFQAEMPDPWPSLEFPSVLQTRKPVRRARPIYQSRFALAASVAILLLCSLWISGMCKDWSFGKTNKTNIDPTTANQGNPFWQPDNSESK